MRKLLSCILVVSFLFTGIFPVSAIAISSGLSRSQLNTQNTKTLNYPSGTDFSTLKSLIETTFSPKQGYQYNCIADNTLCPNYKYTSIVEKAIKLIVLKTYEGNEEFYQTLLPVTSSYYSDDSDELAGSSYPAVQTVLARIPSGTKISDWKTFGFGRSIGGQLLDASFGVDFSENSNSYGMLGAIEQKIKDLKRQKCQKIQGKNCYDSNLSNIYLPTAEELNAETIYLNGSSVKVSSLKDEFEYVVQRDSNDQSLLNPPQNKGNILPIEADFITGSGQYEGYMNEQLFIRTEDISYSDALQNCMRNAQSNQKNSIRCIWNGIDIYERTIAEVPDNMNSKTSYTLRYKKDSYTLEEVKVEIEKNIENQPFTGSEKLSCQSSMNSQVRSECNAAIAIRKDVETALGAYYADKETYPDSIDKLDSSYLPKQETLTKFKENFSYSNTSSDKDGGGWMNPSFEIKYIGHIGENTSSTGTTMKRDYVALLSGATVPEIPSLFAHVPSESMVLYVRNPANLLDILNQKSNTSTRLSGVDVSESIRKFMMTFFELENFDQIQSHLKNEMAIVVNNLDATAPDIVVILSEADRDALSPTAKARVVGSKDGFIFIASSKESLEQLTNLTAEKSLSSAPDFRYVWMKKSQKIQDAFMFVGDEFFEKMLTFETYLSHYRKYRDYARLWALQEVVWAYSDAFGQLPTSLDSLSQLGISSLTGATLAEYNIQDGIVVHKNIGSLKSLKTLPEAHYDFSRITRSEIEDYKTNVLKYREIWRSSLDPMGIVLNRYGDGMEIDFFMTPIPAFEDRDIQEMQKFFGNIAKDSLSFVTNPRIRSGIVSFVFGFDVQKLQQSIQSEKSLQSGFDEFSQEVLDGKNIFDYIGGEFAFSLGGLDPDILDGWNVEKVDVYGSVQVTNEEKGKELIDMLRKKILAEFDRSSSSEAELIKGFLAKPLIEDYNTRKIYYVEGLPIPFVGKIGFAYTFIDNFFIIGLNRSTIRKVIDIANSSDTRKKELIDAGSLATGTVFATIFDGVGSSAQLRALYEKNKTSIPRYMKYLKMNNLSNDSGFRTLLSSYYATQDRNHRLAIPVKQFSYTLGALSLGGDTENIIVRLDEQKLATLTGTTLQTWENLRSESDFPKEILAESGMILTDVLAYKNIGDLVSLAIISHLDAAFDGSESLFRNTTFGLNIGDDEIGFSLRMFRHKDATTSTASPISQELVIIFLIVGILLAGGFVGFMVLQKRKNMGSAPSITPVNPTPSGENLVSPVVPTTTSSIVSDTIPSNIPAATISTSIVSSSALASSDVPSVVSGEVPTLTSEFPAASVAETPKTEAVPAPTEGVPTPAEIVPTESVSTEVSPDVSVDPQ